MLLKDEGRDSRSCEDFAHPQPPAAPTPPEAPTQPEGHQSSRRPGIRQKAEPLANVAPGRTLFFGVTDVDRLRSVFRTWKLPEGHACWWSQLSFSLLH